MPSSKVAPTPNNVALNPKLAKLWQSLEPLLTQALSACALEEPDDPLGFVIERLSEAHQKGRPSELKATRGTAVAFEPKDATGPLRSLADQVLREQREQLAAGATLTPEFIDDAIKKGARIIISDKYVNCLQVIKL